MSVRIVVLGTGRIGSMHSALVARQVPGAVLAGVFDVTESAAAIGAELGCPVAATLEEALAIDADAVAVCTSTDTHVDVMVAAARAGRAIFCEKPVSLELSEVDRGLAAVDTAAVPLQIGFNRRFDPSHKGVADAVAAGVLGDVHLCNITSRDPGPPPIDYIRVSGGIFRDMTIHDFDMARFVTGSDVVEVYATGAVRVDPEIGEAGDIDTAVVVLTHANGAITTIDNSRRAVYGYDQRVEAFGSQGMACSDNFHDANTRVATVAGFEAPPLQHFFLERYTRSYLEQWKAFVAMVRDATPSPVSGADGRAPLVIGLAAWKSVRERRPVRCDEIT
jgi:myo-inositol 2-dehydrogenase / D-chiro-inositol 1-dehydrogenase